MRKKVRRAMREVYMFYETTWLSDSREEKMRDVMGDAYQQEKQ
jgi:hypothetical protein